MKPDGAFYDVHLDKGGSYCTCPDFEFCRQHKDIGGCKHIKAIRAVGLLTKDVACAKDTELESGGVPRADW